MKVFFDDALKQAQIGIDLKDGGPFGAVIIVDEKIVGRGHNTVLRDNDPTAHAEVNAIRDACKNMQRYNLTDAIMVTTCEPCPMCLGAIMWARIATVVYGCDRQDAAFIGFDDEFFYEQMQQGKASFLSQALPAEIIRCRDLMRNWAQGAHKTY